MDLVLAITTLSEAMDGVHLGQHFKLVGFIEKHLGSTAGHRRH